MKFEILDHPLLGRIEFNVSQRAKHFSFRASDDGLRATVPSLSTHSELYDCIEKLLPRLIKLREKAQARRKTALIDPRFAVRADDFSMTVIEGAVRRPQARLSKGELTVTCPKGTDYEDEALQKWLQKVAEESLRHIAKQVLPARLSALAQRYGFRYSDVAIHKTKGRWGSCSGKKKINLSLYLIMLPHRLQDYVMLHELCHTREMNHGAKFWALLDEVTNNQAFALRDEMKKFDTSIFSKTN